MSSWIVTKGDLFQQDKNGAKHQKKGRKMLLCNVALGKSYVVKQLQTKDDMHDNVLPPHGYDSIHAFGLGFGGNIPKCPTDGNSALGVRRDECTFPFLPLSVYEELIRSRRCDLSSIPSAARVFDRI